MRYSVILKSSEFAFHQWKDAPPERSFLRYPHPHRFIYEVEIETEGEPRELEFFSLREVIESWLRDNPFPREFSCESRALQLARFLKSFYSSAEKIWVAVFEDESHGSRICL
jgi:hypothetical protein